MALIKWLPVIVILLSACTQIKNTDPYPSIPGYDLSDPIIIHLKTELDEISGIAYYPKDSSIFAINDELGMLYKIYLRKNIVIKRWRFSDEADYEDIVLKDSVFYILQSNGNIQSVSFPRNAAIRTEAYTSSFNGNNNFESMYYDEAAGRIVLICKNCTSDSKKSISAYAFNPADNTFLDEPFCKVNMDTIGILLHSEHTKFKASAAAIHPVSKDLYILSSVEKAIAIAGKDGSVKEAYLLDPKLFKQPEGICFAPNGDMMISNESAGVGAATILLYKYKPGLHERD